MEDNFALRYVLKHPGVNSRAELVPSPRANARNGALRRWLGKKIFRGWVIIFPTGLSYRWVYVAQMP
jgi:hypothetical protein